MLFLFSNPSGALIMMNLGDIFYIEKLLKSSLFVDSWIFQIKEAFMAPDKKAYPNLEYYIKFIIQVAKFLDFNFNNPSPKLSHRWSLYNLFFHIIAYIPWKLLITTFNKLGNTSVLLSCHMWSCKQS